MSRVLRLRRGTTAETSTFTGKLAEVTVDTTTWGLVVHDNVTAGGHRIATEAYVEANKAVTSIGNAAPNADVQAGSMWFDSDSGRLYVYYANSWVDASPSITQANGTANIGNLVINDTTISPTVSNTKVSIGSYLTVGESDALTMRFRPSGYNGINFNRVNITTTTPTGNANVGLLLNAVSDKFMFFNPVTGNIGVNTRVPGADFEVNGVSRSSSFRANAGYSGGYAFGGMGSTGLFHVVPGGDQVTSLKILHDGVDMVSFYDNNFVSYGGNIAVYNDFSIGGTATLPATTVIGQTMSFPPQNAKLRYADDVEGFTQFALQNKNSSSSSSTDISLFSDNSDDSHNFVDMGITSSGYGDPAYTLYGANDAYLLSAADSGTKLIINTYNNADVVIATGGTMAENIMTRFKNGVGILPGATNNTYDLGATDNRWRNLHAGNIYLGANKLIDGNTSPNSTAPVSPNEGQLWYDLDTGHLFVRVGSVWVDTSLGSNIVAVPTHSTGKSGDVPGLVAYDADFAYYCWAVYDGSTNIWKRVQWSIDTW